MSDIYPTETLRALHRQLYGPIESEAPSVDASSASVLEGSDEKPAKENSGKKSKRGLRKFMGGDRSPFAMDNRDPNHINPHIQVMWDDIIGEPEGLRTPDGCWNCSMKCYDGTRQCCYILLAVLFAPFCAFLSGCQFACMAFYQVWCVGPCLRLFKINMATFRRFWRGCLLACCTPCCESMGSYFSAIKVRYQKLPDDEKQGDADEYFTV